MIGQRLVKVAFTVTGLVLVSTGRLATAVAPVMPAPALPSDTANTCLKLQPGTLTLTAESQRSLTTFLALLAPVTPRVRSVGVTLWRTSPATNLEEPAFLSSPDGVYSVTTGKSASGRPYSIRSQHYSQPTARALVGQILGPELAQVPAIGVLESHSTDPVDCDIRLSAEALIGPPPPSFRVYDCTADGCKQRMN